MSPETEHGEREHMIEMGLLPDPRGPMECSMAEMSEPNLSALVIGYENLLHELAQRLADRQAEIASLHATLRTVRRAAESRTHALRYLWEHVTLTEPQREMIQHALGLPIWS